MLRVFLLSLLFVSLGVDLLAQPTTGPSNFSVTNQDGDRLRVNWTRGNGANILVVASQSATFNGAGIPTNGIDYVENAAFGSGNTVGTGNFVVYEGTATSVNVTNLLPSTTYHFRLFEFNGSGTGTLYNTVNFLAGSGSTVSPPTVGSTNLVATPTGNSASLTWTRGNGLESLVILRVGAVPGDPVNLTSYSASTTFGSGAAVGGGHVVYFANSNSVNVTNLAPNTTYFYKVVEANGPSRPVFDLPNALTGSFTTLGAPTLGSTGFNSGAAQGNSFNISFTRGNGARRLVVARQDLPVAWTPVDGIDYNANASFGAGDNLGGNTFPVADFTGSNLTVTNLTPATTYHIAVFEFNGTATNTVYLTTVAQVLVGSGSTLSPPSTSAGGLTFANINGHSATVSFVAGNGNSRILLARAGAPVTDVPVTLVNYASSSNFSSAPVLGLSRIVFDGGGTTFNLTALQPNTTYHFAIFEYNGSSAPVYKQVDPGVGSFTTQGKPTVLPTALSFAGMQGNSMSLSYTTGNGFGRIVIAKANSPVDVFPADFTSYTASTTFGTAAADLGGGNYVIQNNTAVGGTSFTNVSGLAIGQTYHFAIIEYNGTGTQRIYVTPAEALVGSQATLSAPTVQASNLVFSGITATSVTISWQNGTGTSRMVLVRPGQAVTSLPVNLTSYLSSANYGASPFLGTSRVVYEASGSSVNVTNMPPGEYHVAIVEFNGSSGPVYRTADPLTGIVTIGDKPNVPATNLTFSTITGSSMTLSFVRGNGLSRMIVAKQGSAVDAWPVDNVGYTNGAFGVGSNLGGGSFVVGQGTAGSFSITGLQPTTVYHFAVVEFNGSGTTSLYQLPALVATASQSTLSAPTVATSSFFSNTVTGNSMNISWTNGNGAGRLIIAKAGSPVDQVPTDLTSYLPSNSFGSGTNLGGGNFAVFDNPSFDNFNLINLQPGTTYHFAAFEYNGSGSGKVFLTSSVGRATFTTAPRPSIAAKNLGVTGVNGDRFTLNYTVGNGTRRLIVLKKGGLVDAVPQDLTTYTGGAFGVGSQIGTGNFVTTLTAASSSIIITGLQPDTFYGVAVFELDGSAGNERYLTTEYINQLVSTSTTPTISTFSLLTNSVGSNSVNLGWTNGNGQGRMVVLRPFQPVTFTPANLNTHGTASTSYTSAGILATDHRHILRGNNSNVTITNLAPGTTYHVAIFEYNGSTQPVYTSEPLRGFFTTLPATGLAIGGFDAITFCPSQQVDVPYIFTGVFTTGNQVSIELSDISGSFSAPTIIGVQSTTNATGFVTSILPASLPEGIGYRLRVRSTSPAEVSPDNGVDLQVATSVAATITVVGGQVTSCGTPIQLTTSKPGYNLQWFRNSVAIAQATTSSLSATASGNYQVRIAGASGGCQLFSLPTALTITPRPAFNLQFDTLFCVGAVQDFSGLVSPAGGTLSGPGISGTTFSASTAGVGQHLITYTFTDAVSLCSYSEVKLVRVADLPTSPGGLGATVCAGASAVLTASGGTSGQYRWYTMATGGTAIAGETNATYTTPALAANTDFYVAISNGVCESVRTQVSVIVQPGPAAPGVIGSANCGPGSVTLTASGGSAGQYRWYTVATGGLPLAGGTNATFITPALTANTDYFVAINDGTCESTRTSVTATINPIPAAPTTTSANRCGPGSLTLTASGGSAGQYRWYTVATGGLPLAGETNATFATPALTANTDFFVAINDGTCESTRTSVTATINPIPAAPTTASANRCGPGSVTLTASGGSAGQYRWYTVATGGLPLAGETNATFATPALTENTDFFVAINDGTCESTRTSVTATINPIPAAPTTTSANRCGPGSLTLTASGGSAGQYRWYTVATGGLPLTGETNANFITPALTANTDFFVEINDGTCESTRTSVTATINPIPAKPVITASGPLTFCSGQNVTLTAPNGFTYLWSNNATTQQITVSTAGSFTLVVSSGGCASVASDPAVVVVTNCITNQPPVITTTASQSAINGSTTISLVALLSDPDNNLDLSTLRIVSPPRSGAAASIGTGGILTVNYQGLSFSGTDELTIEVCDLAGLCVQQRITIEVIGDILVYNGLSPNGDGQNDVWVIEYINLVPDARENEVKIFNRWGDLVWEGTNYDNGNIAFRGLNRNGNELPSGTYFYKIQFANRPLLSGYLALRR